MAIDERYDLVIRGGAVYDGTGAPARAADVGGRGDRVVAFGTIPARGGVDLDARGLAVAPGFIEVHSHDDFAVLLDPEMAFKVMQGETTDVVGNCCSGVVPGTLDELKHAVLGPVEFEAKFAEAFDVGELDLPEGATLLSRSATSLRFLVDAPQVVNPILVHALTSRSAPLVSFQEVPRKLEQVYLKTMAAAQGVAYAA